MLYRLKPEPQDRDYLDLHHKHNNILLTNLIFIVPLVIQDIRTHNIVPKIATTTFVL